MKLRRGLYDNVDQIVKRKFPFSFAAVAVCLLAGCNTGKYAEQFNETSDEYKIEEAVYGFMLQRHFWDSGDYAAVFLKGSDDEVASLIGKFPNHVPPIKPSRHADLQPNRTPIDRDTGKPAMIFSVEVAEPSGNEAEAIGTWYGGVAMTGHYTFTLKKSTVNGKFKV
jgi:hypothetical protein